jgi:DNA-binding XRE family transcriptional regulator
MTQIRNETLIAQRKKHNLRQGQVASAVGISYRQYQKIEAGTSTPNVETAISIADLLKSDVRDLFGPRQQSGENNTQSNFNTGKGINEISVVAAER